MSAEYSGRRQYRDNPGRAGPPRGPASPPGPPRTRQRQVSRPAAEQIEAQLRRGYLWLRFVPALEDRFSSDGSLARRRYLGTAALVGVLIYCFLSVNDAEVFPDQVALCRTLLAILVPLELACAWLVSSLRTHWIRETAMAAAALIVTASVIWTIAASRAPTALTHSAVLILVPMFAGIAARLRFWYTLAVSLLTLVGFAVFVHGRTPMEQLIASDYQSVLLAAVVFTLIASYSLEYRERTGYLLRMLDRRRRHALADANRRLRKLSMLDSLTAIGNRRQFEADLAEGWTRTGVAAESLSLLLLDVDFFKRFNDGYGHPEGDACLQRIAGVLAQAAAERAGKAARIGGEEFAVILPVHDSVTGARIAESIRAAIQHLAIPHGYAPPPCCVTVSIGVGVAQPAKGSSRSELMNAADRALYRAKTGGRNRVEVEVIEAAPVAQLRLLD